MKFVGEVQLDDVVCYVSTKAYEKYCAMNLEEENKLSEYLDSLDKVTIDVIETTILNWEK